MPINYTFRGDKEKALRLSKLADQQLKTLLEHMKFQDLKQYRRVFNLPDGSSIICTSQFGQNNIIVNCPISVPVVTTVPISPKRAEVQVKSVPFRIFFRCTFNGESAQYGGEQLYLEYKNKSGEDVIKVIPIWTDEERPDINHIGIGKIGLNLDEVYSDIMINSYATRKVSFLLNIAYAQYLVELRSSLNAEEESEILPGIFWYGCISYTEKTTLWDSPYYMNDMGVQGCGWPIFIGSSAHTVVTGVLTKNQASFCPSEQISVSALKVMAKKSSFLITDYHDSSIKKRLLVDIDVLVPIKKIIYKHVVGTESSGVSYDYGVLRPNGCAYKNGFIYSERQGIGGSAIHVIHQISNISYAGSGFPVPIINGFNVDWFTETEVFEVFEEHFILSGDPETICDFLYRTENRWGYTSISNSYVLKMFY